MKNTRSYTQIAADIDMVLKDRKLVLRDCVELYNRHHATAINSGIMRPLNKDFVQRVRSGKCKVVSTRVIALCDFLGVNPYYLMPHAITHELQGLGALINQSPELEVSLTRLLREVKQLVGEAGKTA